MSMTGQGKDTTQNMEWKEKLQEIAIAVTATRGRAAIKVAGQGNDDRDDRTPEQQVESMTKGTTEWNGKQ